jgi:hypothetical protein
VLPVVLVLAEVEMFRLLEEEMVIFHLHHLQAVSDERAPLHQVQAARPREGGTCRIWFCDGTAGSKETDVGKLAKWAEL